MKKTHILIVLLSLALSFLAGYEAGRRDGDREAVRIERSRHSGWINLYRGDELEEYREEDGNIYQVLDSLLDPEKYKEALPPLNEGASQAT